MGRPHCLMVRFETADAGQRPSVGSISTHYTARWMTGMASFCLGLRP